MANKCPCCNLEIPKEWHQHGGWDFSVPVTCAACKAPMKRLFNQERFAQSLVYVCCQFCILAYIFPPVFIGLTFLICALWLIAVFKQSIRYVAALDCTEKKIRYS